MIVELIRGIVGGSISALMSAFNQLLFLSFVLDDVGVTRCDFAKCRACLTRLILKTHNRCCLRKIIILDVYRILSITIYFDPAPPPWKVVANSIYPFVYSIRTTRKGVCI